MSLRIRTWSVCALSLVLSLGIGLSAQAAPAGYLSIVNNAGSAASTLMPVVFDGLPQQVAPAMIANEIAVEKANWATNVEVQTALAVIGALAGGPAQANIVATGNEYIRISWTPGDLIPDDDPASNVPEGSAILGTINNQNAPTTFIATAFADLPGTAVIARSVLVAFLIDGVFVPMTAFSFPMAPPFFAAGGTPAVNVLLDNPVPPPGDFAGAVCGTTWTICGISHAISTQGQLFSRVDEVRLQFFLTRLPEPGAGLLLGTGLLALGALRRRASL